MGSSKQWCSPSLQLVQLISSSFHVSLNLKCWCCDIANYHSCPEACLLGAFGVLTYIPDKVFSEDKTSGEGKRWERRRRRSSPPRLGTSSGTLPRPWEAVIGWLEIRRHLLGSGSNRQKSSKAMWGRLQRRCSPRKSKAPGEVNCGVCNRAKSEK